MNKTLSYKIKCANVFLTLLIVLLHCLPGEKDQDYVYRLIGSFCDIAVPVFFTISSFLYFGNWKLDKSCYIKKLKSRVFSLLIPLIVYNLLLWGYYRMTVLSGIFPNKDMPSGDIYGILTYVYNSVGDPPLWYLRSLFFFVLVAPIFYGLTRLLGKLVPVICVGLIFLLFNFPYTSMLYWTPCLLLGAFLAVNKKMVGGIVKQLMPSSNYIIEGVILVWFIVLIYFNIWEFQRVNNMFYYAYRIFSVLVVALFLLKRTFLPRYVVERIAPITFFIYCVHFPIKELLWGIFNHLWGGNFLIIFILTLVVIYIMASILSKNRILWSILTGNRKK